MVERELERVANELSIILGPLYNRGVNYHLWGSAFLQKDENSEGADLHGLTASSDTTLKETGELVVRITPFQRNGTNMLYIEPLTHRPNVRREIGRYARDKNNLTTDINIYLDSTRPIEKPARIRRDRPTTMISGFVSI